MKKTPMSAKQEGIPQENDTPRNGGSTHGHGKAVQTYSVRDLKQSLDAYKNADQRSAGSAIQALKNDIIEMFNAGFGINDVIAALQTGGMHLGPRQIAKYLAEAGINRTLKSAAKKSRPVRRMASSVQESEAAHAQDMQSDMHSNMQSNMHVDVPAYAAGHAADPASTELKKDFNDQPEDADTGTDDGRASTSTDVPNQTHAWTPPAPGTHKASAHDLSKMNNYNVLHAMRGDDHEFDDNNWK